MFYFFSNLSFFRKQIIRQRVRNSTGNLHTVSHHNPKTVLCYGDSNTWGYDSVTGSRFAIFSLCIRWPGVVQTMLGTNIRIVECGLSGRTTVMDDHAYPSWCNGRKVLGPTLHTTKPIDLVILFLGTNDLQTKYRKTAADVRFIFFLNKKNKKIDFFFYKNFVPNKIF
eukprot:GSMAST32.ASY1.ANO1.1513.1 assembled CDS